MTKITNEQSREIYELATSPTAKMSNVEIGKKFDISERVVRFHVAKWEKELKTIAKTNEKAAQAVANNAVVASEIKIDCKQEIDQLIKNVKSSIKDARDSGVSPEKLAPLYNNWLRALDSAAELLGEINRASQVNINVGSQIIQSPEWLELRTVILQFLEPYPDIKIKLAEVLASRGA